MTDPDDIILVRAASRLHFGVFGLPTAAATHWPSRDGATSLPARHFGGVGLMIDQPGVEVVVQSHATWAATGPAADRALAWGQRFMAGLGGGESQRAFRIDVARCAPQHVGLGVGTQLALALARALAHATGHASWNAVELGRRVGRGLRSSLGIHGFEHGGLLVEGGKREPAAIAPLLVHEALPEEWRVLVIIPDDERGTHGVAEADAFHHLANQEQCLRRTESLCRLVLLGILPAIQEKDLSTFGDAVYEFNHTVGEWFAPSQGGVYAGAAIAARVAWLRRLGIRGVGQSSWGPTVFAIDGAERLESARQQLLAHELGRDCKVLVCRPSPPAVSARCPSPASPRHDAHPP